MDDQTAAEKRLAKSRSQLESLDSSSSEDDDEGGSDGTRLKKTASGGSLFDDLSSWWDDLDIEVWAKTALDDLEALVTGSQTLKAVALCPGADWQVRMSTQAAARAVRPPLAHCSRAVLPAQPDDARGTCNLCDNPFSFTRRRHHCRCVSLFLFFTNARLFAPRIVL